MIAKMAIGITWNLQTKASAFIIGFHNKCSTYIIHCAWKSIVRRRTTCHILTILFAKQLHTKTVGNESPKSTIKSIYLIRELVLAKNKICCHLIIARTNFFSIFGCMYQVAVFSI